MSGIKDPMSFLYGFFHEKASKKARYPNVTNEASDITIVWFFPWKCQKKLDTQMSGIKHPMSFLYGFSMKMSKKARYPNVTNEASAQTESKKS